MLPEIGEEVVDEEEEGAADPLVVVSHFVVIRPIALRQRDKQQKVSLYDLLGPDGGSVGLGTLFPTDKRTIDGSGLEAALARKSPICRTAIGLGWLEE